MRKNPTPAAPVGDSRWVIPDLSPEALTRIHETSRYAEDVFRPPDRSYQNLIVADRKVSMVASVNARKPVSIPNMVELLKDVMQEHASFFHEISAHFGYVQLCRLPPVAEDTDT